MTYANEREKIAEMLMEADDEGFYLRELEYKVSRPELMLDLIRQGINDDFSTIIDNMEKTWRK